MEVETGDVLATAGSPEKELPMHAEKLGWAEQHPRLWWDNLKSATQQITLKIQNSKMTRLHLKRIPGLGGRIHRC